MKINRKDFGELAEGILNLKFISLTKFYSDKLRIRATRRGKIDKRDKSTEILFTVGPPNFKEREYLKRKGIIPKQFVINK